MVEIIKIATIYFRVLSQKNVGQSLSSQKEPTSQATFTHMS